MSSPWEKQYGATYLGSHWPEDHKAWAEKEQWAGCTELDEPIRADCPRAKLYLQACQNLGRAATAILTV